jgi:hypothetical protein
MAAANIIRKKIRDAVASRMALIDGTGGYYTAIGNHITIKKTNPYGPNKVDGIDIADESETQTLVTEAEELEDRSLIFRLAVALKQIDPDKVLEAIADVEKAVNVDDRWGGLAIRTVPLGNDDEVDQQENIFRGVNIRIRIEYSTLKFNSES